MNALIVKEERRERERQREINYATSEDEHQYLLQKHMKEREIASERVKSLISAHL